ncbi:Nitrogen permease regulator 3 [Saxophila tyrrhenica]|uniref:Nitrogen permease regulator 3 n=1 Tax=Saxophila tyrrhenica TaxID=1690608 RepID=A0AAV9P6U8_9PEZI|nr:Nitrogen permease regulator 3 [Saxophila tyrrhenica]
MSNSSVPLVAILLIVHSRPGPKLVFQYPANPEVQTPLHAEDGQRHGHTTGLGVDSVQRNSAVEGSTVEKATRSQSISNPTDGKIFGLSVDTLERVLSPGRWSDRKKFEVSLSGLTFVSHPVYADREGRWTKSRHDRKASPEASNDRSSTAANFADQSTARDGEHEATADLDITITEPPENNIDFSHVAESFESGNALSLGVSENSGSTTSAVTAEPLTAFHVLFALDSSAPSQPDRVNVFYEQLAKKLSQALTYCQKQSSYVGIESRRLMQMQSRLKQENASNGMLCSRSIEGSELAWALSVIYDRVRNASVATFRLNGMEMSLQIQHVEDHNLSQCSAILLLDDRDTLLRELSSPEQSPLAYFIRHSTPTKSLQKQAAKLGTPVRHLLQFAQHLIKWKNARAIAPLQPRNTYVVHPGTSLDSLEGLATDYASRFAVLPSLPQMLKILGGRPVKYGQLIPSRDHRAPYMDILAYLIRHNLVERLSTFGWLQTPAQLSRRCTSDAELNENQRPPSVSTLLSPLLRPQADDDTASVSSERTAVPVFPGGNGRLPAAAKTKAGTGPKFLPEAARMVRDPSNPTDDDLSYLQCIRAMIRDDTLRERLPSLSAYFDGQTALEDIAAREGLKRSMLDSWLEMLVDDGILVTFRHV